MKNSILVLGLLLLSACGEASEAPEVDRSRAEYRTFVNLGCLRCHGPDLAGTHKAPHLAGLDRNWTPEQLTAFLKDPQPFRERDPRIRDLARQYAAHEMPAYDVVDSVLVDLVDFLLAPGP